MAERIQSFEEFWPFYVREHSHPMNRALHFVGSTGALMCLGGFAMTGNPLLLAGAPLVGYGCAWFGHFVIEKNRPASFSYPLWSFRADWKMYAYIWMRRMAAEVERAHALAAAEQEKISNGTSHHAHAPA